MLPSGKKTPHIIGSLLILKLANEKQSSILSLHITLPRRNFRHLKFSSPIEKIVTFSIMHETKEDIFFFEVVCIKHFFRIDIFIKNELITLYPYQSAQCVL